MTPSHAVAPLIPWYAKGKLDAHETRQVEEHLAGCAECRGLLELARDAREGFDSLGAEGLAEHVQAQLLASFVEDPDALEADTERWIRSHLATCAVCEEAGEAYRGALAEAAPAAGGARAVASGSAPATGWPSSIWAALSGTLLRPAPALLYLLALVALVVPLMRPGGGPGVSPAVTVVPPALTVDGELRFRGEDAAAPLRMGRPAGGMVLLRLRPRLAAEDLTGPARSLDIEIRQADRLLWSDTRPAADLASGVLPVLLDVRALRAGREHVVRIVYRGAGSDLDGREVLRRTLIVDAD